MRAIGKYVILELKKEEVSGGLIIPEGVDRRIMGRAKLVSGEVEGAKTGDTVYYKRYAVDEMVIRGVRYGVIDKKFVLAKSLD